MVFLLPDEQQGGIHTRPVWQTRVSGVLMWWKLTGFLKAIFSLHMSVCRLVGLMSDWTSRSASRSESSPSRHKNAAVTEIRGGEVILNVCPLSVPGLPACLHLQPPTTATEESAAAPEAMRPQRDLLNILIKSKSSPCCSSGTCFWPNVMNSSSLDAIHTWNNPADLCFIPLWKV